MKAGGGGEGGGVIPRQTLLHTIMGESAKLVRVFITGAAAAVPRSSPGYGDEVTCGNNNNGDIATTTLTCPRKFPKIVVEQSLSQVRLTVIRSIYYSC